MSGQRLLAVVLMAACASAITPADAANNKNQGGQVEKSKPPETKIDKTTLVGTVKAVDVAAKRVTVAGHFPVIREGKEAGAQQKIAAAMKETTRTFAVPVNCKIVTKAKPAAVLKDLKPGDSVSVSFDEKNGELTAMSITPPQE